MNHKTQPKPLSRREAADFLTAAGFPIAATTLTKLACIGGGPPYRRWGRGTVYEQPDLIEWAESRAGPKQRSATQMKSDVVFDTRAASQ